MHHGVTGNAEAARSVRGLQPDWKRLHGELVFLTNPVPTRATGFLSHQLGLGLGLARGIPGENPDTTAWGQTSAGHASLRRAAPASWGTADSPGGPGLRVICDAFNLVPSNESVSRWNQGCEMNDTTLVKVPSPIRSPSPPPLIELLCQCLRLANGP